jgi:N-acetylated-alpha-linked acidic dipeptidase
MRKLLPLAAAILTLMLPRIVNAAQAPLGFTPAQAKEQLQREADYDSSLNAENLRKWSREMTTRPHHLGSPKAKENAEFVADLFRKWGYETEIEVFHVLFPTPKTRELSLLRPYPFKASLTEQIVKTDSAAAALEKEALPPYNAYSGDGEVVGALVYVNQGLPRDYEVLDRHGIDVKGKIVIARYGGSWRGIKVKVAAEKGAIGCIIYNDPLADGYTQGGAYPNGAYKHGTAVQRGSVIDLPMRPGDPLTPNYGAVEGAKRLPCEEAETIMKIPVLPISSVDAEPLLKALDGPVAPSDWRGALPLTYRLGGGKTVVRLKAEFNWDLVPTYNVIAKMKGSTFPDQWVLRGNHHDAWVIGARDPISGLVPLLEQARVTSQMTRSGWRPKRTLVFCVWDGEEPGMLGSTEWVEHHRDELKEKAVAYINTDTNARGFLRIGGAHSIETVAAEVAHQVPDPLTGVSVSERLRSAKLLRGTAAEKKEYRTRKNIRIDALGSGSDYSAFLQHLGIASYYISFRGEGVGGEYHTCFDTFDHYSTYIDPDYSYGVALAKMCGRITLRLADADILPFDFNAQANTVNRYVDDIVKVTDSMRTETDTHNRLLAENRFKLVADPTQKYVPPSPKDPVPHINFAPLLNSASELEQAAAVFHEALAPIQSGDRELSNAQLAKFNQLVYQTERALIHEKGLPRRPWFRHQIYAPGFYTGYGVKTIPGVREAIEERKWKEADEQIGHAADALNRMAAQIEAAAKLIEK